MKSWNCVPVDIWRSASRLWISRGDGSQGLCGGETGCVRRLFVKPASPLRVWLVGVVKPASPLLARMGLFWAVGAVHWCRGFQVRVSVPTQWPTSYMQGRLESSGCSSGPTNPAGWGAGGVRRASFVPDGARKGCVGRGMPSQQRPHHHAATTATTPRYNTSRHNNGPTTTPQP